MFSIPGVYPRSFEDLLPQIKEFSVLGIRILVDEWLPEDQIIFFDGSKKCKLINIGECTHEKKQTQNYRLS